MEITLQYFDGCPNWEATAHNLSLIANESTDITIRYDLIDTHNAAVARGFRGSPTVLVDGIDPFAEKNAVGLACRIYTTEQGLAGSPTLDQLREAITAAGRS